MRGSVAANRGLQRGVFRRADRRDTMTKNRRTIGMTPLGEEEFSESMIVRQNDAQKTRDEEEERQSGKAESGGAKGGCAGRSGLVCLGLRGDETLAEIIRGVLAKVCVTTTDRPARPPQSCSKSPRSPGFR
jgi:hypothetical protein